MANEEKVNETQSVENIDHMENVKELVSQLSQIIDNDEKLSKMNFGLFYQHGRIGFVDLDAFAETTKVKLSQDGEEKTLTEIGNDIDRNKE